MSAWRSLSLQRRRGVDRAGHQFGQHAAPGAAVGRCRPGVGRLITSRPSRLTVKARVGGLQGQRRVGAGEAAVGLDRQGAEIGFVEVAIADRAIGLQHDALDIDVGGDRGAAPWPGSEACRSRSRRRRPGQRRAECLPHAAASIGGKRINGTVIPNWRPRLAQAVGGRPRFRSSRRSRGPPVEGLGAPIRCAQSSAMTAPLMWGSRYSASKTDSGSHSRA